MQHYLKKTKEFSGGKIHCCITPLRSVRPTEVLHLQLMHSLWEKKPQNLVNYSSRVWTRTAVLWASTPVLLRSSS